MKTITFNPDDIAAVVKAEAVRLKCSYLCLDYSFGTTDYDCAPGPHGWKAYTTQGGFTDFHATPEAALAEVASKCGPEAIRAKALALQKEAAELLAKIGEGGAS